MKKKAKRYQEGGVLRDRYGNPVKSGSGETVRTSYPERSYNEQSTADMTESSDYTGRRRKSPERITDDVESDSAYMSSGRAPNIGYGGGKESSEESDKSEELTAKTFKQAFAAARRSGDKTFEFGGKKYTTDLAKPKAPKASAPDESSAETSRLARQSKAAETVKSEKRGFGPKLTFNTPEKLEKARKAYYSGFAKGGSVSASKRADGIAQRGKTRGRIC
jgi:hypothetical protein